MSKLDCHKMSIFRQPCSKTVLIPVPHVCEADSCVYHVKDISSLQSSISLVNLTEASLCKPSDIPPEGIMDKAVAVQSGGCNFLEKARIAQEGGARALLIANDSVQVSYQVLTPSFELILSSYARTELICLHGFSQVLNIISCWIKKIPWRL